MGNFTSHPKTHIYEPLLNQSADYLNLSQQIQYLFDRNQKLEEEIKKVKNDLDLSVGRLDKLINTRNDELLNSLLYYNNQQNEKINIITKDMENLLNNDKILLDKLIEKDTNTITET